MTFKSVIMLSTAVIVGAFYSVPAYSQGQIFQEPASSQKQQWRQAVPDENTLARLVWATMIALDNANRTENYTVLYFLGSPDFQRRNAPRQLSDIFLNLRQNRVDIGRTILSTPTYYIPPEILSDGTLRLRGGFDYRPKSVRFDLLYANVNGGWRINAISVVEMDATEPK
ncbi:MAG: hypothetical protein ACSHXY_02145 [Alphaproteobacteria bacterium]